MIARRWLVALLALGCCVGAACASATNVSAPQPESGLGETSAQASTSTPEPAPTPQPVNTPTPDALPTTQAVDPRTQVAVETFEPGDASGPEAVPTWDDFVFGPTIVGSTRDEIVAELGEPLVSEPFEWHAGTGYVLTYPDIELTLHYGVSFAFTDTEGVCTRAAVCIGDSMAQVEAAYGPGQVGAAADGLSESWMYPLDGGYCSADFGFVESSTDASPSLASMLLGCVPD